MKYLAGYLLCTMGGNKSPSAKDIESVLGSVGLDVEMENANKVVSALSGKSIEEVMKAGLLKIASVPSGGGTAPSAGATSETTVAPTESKKEEKKEEPKEESDEDMGFGLFD